MGVLILITELLYALEPVIVYIVDFFGDTLTFVVGGVLIAVTGFIFQRISSDEVLLRKEELAKEKAASKKSQFPAIILAGLVLGLGHALILAYFPYKTEAVFAHAVTFPNTWLQDCWHFQQLQLCPLAGWWPKWVLKNA